MPDDATIAAGAATAEPAKPDAEPAKAVDPMAIKFDGDIVPEKFRGKTPADVFKAYQEAETALNEKAKLVSDWEAWYMKTHDPNKAAAGNGGGSVEEEPVFDERQIGTLSKMLNQALLPITQALDNASLESIKSIVPDFGSFEKRAREIYETMPPQFKYSPKHGWVFAYNMAKSEMIGLPKREAPPGMSPGGPAGPPKTEDDLTETQLAWAKKQGLTPEEYKKFQTPLENA